MLFSNILFWHNSFPNCAGLHLHSYCHEIVDIKWHNLENFHTLIYIVSWSFKVGINPYITKFRLLIC